MGRRGLSDVINKAIICHVDVLPIFRYFKVFKRAWNGIVSSSFEPEP